MNRYLEKKAKIKKVAQYFSNIISTVELTNVEEIDKNSNDKIRVVNLNSSDLLFIKRNTYYIINVNTGSYSIGSYLNFDQNFNRYGGIRKVKFITIPFVRSLTHDFENFEQEVEIQKQLIETQELGKQIHLDDESELFNLIFEKSKIENSYYFLFMTPQIEFAFPLPCLLKAKSTQKEDFIYIMQPSSCTEIMVKNPAFGNFYNLFIDIFCSKFLNNPKSKKQVDIKRIVKFKNPDPKLLPEKCTETYKVKKYVPKQNGKVYLEGKSGLRIITNLKYLKNVRNTIKKKNNIIETPFSWSV